MKKIIMFYESFMKENNIAIFFLSLVDINPETLQPDTVPCWTREREECRTG